MYQRVQAPSSDAIAKSYRFIRLPITVDPQPLSAELRSAGIDWMESQWKWHRRTQFCILRGGPPREHTSDRMFSGSGVDTPELARLPAIRHFLDTAFPSPASLAWIGVSPPETRIFIHVDDTDHWYAHHRIHVPLETNGSARLCIDGGFVHMPAGSVWALNNSRPHGAENLGPRRTHLVLDLPPTPEVEALLDAGQRVAGEADAAAFERLSSNPLANLSEEERENRELMARFESQ